MDNKDEDIGGVSESEKIVKSCEAEKAQLELSREKLYHAKLLEIAGYDDPSSCNSY